MTARSNFFPIIRSQVNDIVSDTKAIIETHVAVKLYYNYTEKIIKNTTIIVHYTMETKSNVTVTSMNLQKAGFH